jgi:hypothetical protein
MPNLRDRENLKPPEKFKVWEDGDSHAPGAIRVKVSRKKAKDKIYNKKYREMKKDKSKEIVEEEIVEEEIVEKEIVDEIVEEPKMSKPKKSVPKKSKTGSEMKVKIKFKKK